MMTTVAAVTTTRGSWYGVDRTPRVTISRTCTPSVMPLASIVSYSRRVSSSRRQADIHRDRLGAFEQPVEVAVEEAEPAPCGPEALPTRRRRA